MSKLIVVPLDGVPQAVDAQAGSSVMEIIRDAGFEDLRAFCGGNCSCATCHVYVDATRCDSLPSMSEDEDTLLDSTGQRQPTSRLSCQIAFDPALLDGMTVRIAPGD